MFEGEPSNKQGETTKFGVTRRIMESIGDTAVRVYEETSVKASKVQVTIQNSYLYDRMICLFRDLFQSTPKWFQEYSVALYEKGRHYPPIVDFFHSFILFFAIPFALFILWCIGSILCYGIALAATWTAMNTFSMIVGLMFIFPFFVLALFLASITTFIINIGRLTIIFGKYIYRATLMFFRHLIRSDVDQGNSGGGSTSAATIGQASGTSGTANRDVTTITTTTFDT